MDGGVVFAVEGVAEPVQRFDAPVLAGEGGEAFRGAGVVGQVGDAQCRDRGEWGAGGVAGVALEEPGLVDVRQGEVRWGG